MGELHIDIIQDRLLREFKVPVELGELQVSYRESINNEVTQTQYTHVTTISGKPYKVSIRNP